MKGDIMDKRDGCKFFYENECEHGLTHECPMHEENWETCIDAETKEDKY